MAATIACSLQAALGGVAQRGGYPLRSKLIGPQWCSKAYPESRRVVDSAKFLLRCHKVVASRALENYELRTEKRLVRTFARASTGAASAGGANGSTDSKELAILWFKHDLRLDDHPGVAAASAFKKVLPVYVFDPHVCAGWSKELLDSLFDAIADLRKELRLLGSDLVVLTGRTADVLTPLALKFGATSIIAEEEVESSWKLTVDSVLESLEESELSPSNTRLAFHQWCASLYEARDVESIPDSYKEFLRLGLRTLAPLPPPTSLPRLPKDIDSGALPNYGEFVASIDAISGENPWWETLRAAQEQPGESLLPQAASPAPAPSSGQYGPFKGVLKWRDEYILESPDASLLKKQGLYATEEDVVIGEYFIKGGATGASNVLDGYLRFLEPTNRDDYKAVYEHIWEMEKKPGASFRKLFGNALALGTISRRRVMLESLQYERDRNGGRLSPFGYSTFTVGAAVGDVKAMEWFDLLQKKSEMQASQKGFNVGAWRWRGYHIQYSSMGNEGPAVLLVHGFGAFWEHFRDNLRGLAEKGYRVFALTLIGFGRSEKPNVTYTEILWAEVVRDFIVEVVREPVVLAGNSIGGFTTTIVAGLWPSLVSSLILLNTAGKVIPDYKGLIYKKPRGSSPIAKPVSKLLLFYLKTSSDKLLTRCYPKQPSRVDNWLLNEVKRASFDPGNTTVLESIFLLKAPLPLNFFLDRYNGKVLAIQGKHDPLQKNARRPEMLQALCSNVSVKYLDAGHCPHDELPEEVNQFVDEFVRRGSESGKQDRYTPDMANLTDDDPATAAEIIEEEIKLITEDLKS